LGSWQVVGKICPELAIGCRFLATLGMAIFHGLIKEMK